MVGRWATRHGDRYLPARFEFRYGIPIGEGYGRSDGSCISTANPPAGPREAGTVGLLLPGQTVRLVDSAGEPVAQGQAGEVVIKGPNVMRGYLNRPEESAKTLVDGWLRAGDIGRFDEDGYRPGDHRRTIPAPAAAYRSGPFR